MTIQSGAPASTQVSRLVDVNGNPLGVSANPFFITPSGTVLSTLPQSTVANIVASRTDTASFNSADIVPPAFELAIFLVRISAVSGTTPTMTVGLATKTSTGEYFTGAGGTITGSLSTTGATTLVINNVNNSAASMLGPLYRIVVTIGGTTPSFTWYLDMIYK